MAGVCPCPRVAGWLTLLSRVSHSPHAGRGPGCLRASPCTSPFPAAVFLSVAWDHGIPCQGAKQGLQASDLWPPGPRSRGRTVPASTPSRWLPTLQPFPSRCGWPGTPRSLGEAERCLLPAAGSHLLLSCLGFSSASYLKVHVKTHHGVPLPQVSRHQEPIPNGGAAFHCARTYGIKGKRPLALHFASLRRLWRGGARPGAGGGPAAGGAEV